MQMTITLLILGCAGAYLAWCAWHTLGGKSAGGCGSGSCGEGGCSSKEKAKALLSIETPQK